MPRAHREAPELVAHVLARVGARPSVAQGERAPRRREADPDAGDRRGATRHSTPAMRPAESSPFDPSSASVPTETATAPVRKKAVPSSPFSRKRIQLRGRPMPCTATTAAIEKRIPCACQPSSIQAPEMYSDERLECDVERVREHAARDAESDEPHRERAVSRGEKARRDEHPDHREPEDRVRRGHDRLEARRDLGGVDEEPPPEQGERRDCDQPVEDPGKRNRPEPRPERGVDGERA